MYLHTIGRKLDRFSSNILLWNSLDKLCLLQFVQLILVYNSSYSIYITRLSLKLKPNSNYIGLVKSL